MAKILTEETFNETVSSDKLTVVDFYTETCPPCKKLAPIIEKLAEEYHEIVNICKVDASEDMGLAVKYKISAVPTLVFLKNGEEIRRQLGLISEENLRALVEEHK